MNEEFYCDFSEALFDDLRVLLLTGTHSTPAGQRRCTGGTTGGPSKKVANKPDAATAGKEVKPVPVVVEPPPIPHIPGKQCHSFCKYVHCFPNKRQHECDGCLHCNGPHPCEEFCRFQGDPCGAHPANCWGCSNCPGGAGKRMLAADAINESLATARTSL